MPHRAGGPVPQTARQGRESQRYGPGGERLVAGSIPLRYSPDDPGPSGVHVLMISTRGGQAFVFPKGGWESDESVETAAQRETMEEAGVRGELEGGMLGAFAFHSRKAERLQTAHKGLCIAHVFALRVTEELEVWPEGGQRQRLWVPLAEAAGRARDEWMRQALAVYVHRHGWEGLVNTCVGTLALAAPAQPQLQSHEHQKEAAVAVQPLHQLTEQQGNGTTLPLQQPKVPS